jgi:hypothetical protein
MLMSSALFWDVMQCRVIIRHRRLRTTRRFDIQGSRIYLQESRSPFLTPDDGPDTLSVNVVRGLPLDAE